MYVKYMSFLYFQVIWIATFAAVIFTSVGIGLLIGAVLGIISVIMRTLWYAHFDKIQ